MSTNEIKDRRLTGLMNEAAELDRDFHEALDKLRGLADDFSEGSQQRFVNQMREVTALRDQLWQVQQSIFRMDADQTSVPRDEGWQVDRTEPQDYSGEF